MIFHRGKQEIQLIRSGYRLVLKGERVFRVVSGDCESSAEFSGNLGLRLTRAALRARPFKRSTINAV